MIPYKRLILLICCIPLIAGCWDSIEVEERGFVTGITVDLANESSPESSPTTTADGQNEHENQGATNQKDTNTIKLTQQLLNPSSLGSQQSNNSNSNSASFRNLSLTGDTIIGINRDMVKQIGRRTNVTHLNVVLFSEAVAQEEDLFANLMDIFLREKEMLRNVKIAITKDEASNYLDILPENEKIPSKYLSNVLENKSNLDIAQPITVGNVQSYLLSNRSFIIPLISQVNETTVNYEGISVYNGSKNKIVGTLTGDEAKGLNFIHSKNKTGTINLTFDEHNVTFEILEIKSKISLKNKKMRPLQFEITIDVNSGIAEQFGSFDIMKEKNYEKLQKALEKEIKQIVLNTVSILQNDLQTDVIGLNKHLYERHYPLWESVKDHWEKDQHIFKNSEVHITVNATIEKPGNIIKSH